MSSFLNARLASLEAYVPGEQPAGREYIKLNANESPYPPSPGVERAVRESAGRMNFYPDAACRSLRAALAARYGLRPENVMVTDGSDDILNFCFMGFCEHGVAYPAVSYGFYEVFAALHGVESSEIPMGPGLTVEPENWERLGKTVVLANPNAQTGIALPLAGVERIVASNAGNLVVLDEAYVDFGAESAAALLGRYENLLVVRTFSKSRSLAGARLGFALGSAGIIADLERLKYSTNPYSVGLLALAAGEAALAEDGYYMEKCRLTAAERERLSSALGALGFSSTPSAANFLLTRPPEGMGAEELFLALRSRGVLVRYFGGGALSEYLRITVGSPEQNDVLLGEVESILKEAAEK